MKSLLQTARIVLWLNLIWWILAAFFFIPFSEMDGAGKRFLWAMVTLAFSSCAIFELIWHRTED